MVDIDTYDDLKYAKAWPLFEKMRLLVLGCGFPQHLTFQGGKNTMETLGTKNLPDHPIWLHISNMYALCSSCECFTLKSRRVGISFHQISGR